MTIMTFLLLLFIAACAAGAAGALVLIVGGGWRAWAGYFTFGAVLLILPALLPRLLGG